MPKGPKGQKRPADVIGNAILVARIATEESAETPTKDIKEIRSRAGRSGGRARAKVLTPEMRKEIAKRAADKRLVKEPSEG